MDAGAAGFPIDRAAGRVLVVPFVIVVFAMNVAGGPSHGSN